MAAGKTPLNKLERLEFQSEWDVDPWCCLFRRELKKRWPQTFWSGPGEASPEEICNRIFFRELFSEHPVAYQYSGWFLSNVSCDLATEQPPPFTLESEWEDGEY